MEKKVKIIVAAAAAVVVVAAIAIFFALKGGGKSLDEYLDLGAKYLEEQDYDKAIEAYTEALKIDDMSVEAYLGLADAYVGKGDIEKAKEVLQTGYDKTGDERLLDKLNNFGSGAAVELPADGSLVEVQLTDAGKKLVEYALKADRVTYNGATVDGKQAASMTTEAAAAAYGLTYNPDMDWYWYFDEVTGPDPDPNALTLIKSNGAINVWGETTGGNTQSGVSLPLSDGTGTAVSLYYVPGSTLPEYAEAKSFFDFLDANNVKTLNDLISLATGQEVEDGTLLLIDEDNGVYFLAREDSGSNLNIYKNGATISAGSHDTNGISFQVNYQ